MNIWDIIQNSKLQKKADLSEDGKILPEQLPALPSVSIYREAPTFNELPSIYMMIDWSGIDWDTDNEFSLDTDRYTAAKNGKRFVLCNFYWSETVANKTFKICIYKNGVLFKVSDFQAAAAIPLSTSIMAIIDMNIGDYLQFYIYQNSAVNLNLSMTKAGTYLNIQKVS